MICEKGTLYNTNTISVAETNFLTVVETFVSEACSAHPVVARLQHSMVPSREHPRALIIFSF